MCPNSLGALSGSILHRIVYCLEHKAFLFRRVDCALHRFLNEHLLRQTDVERINPNQQHECEGQAGAQWAVRSAKETIFDVIGIRLDDQLAHEAFMAYNGASNSPVAELLNNFAAKPDKGRVGKNKTKL